MGAVFWDVSETNAKKTLWSTYANPNINSTFTPPYSFIRETQQWGCSAREDEQGSEMIARRAEAWPCDRCPFPQNPNKINRAGPVAAARVSHSSLTAGHVCRGEAGLRSSQKIRLERQGEAQESTRASPAHLQRSSGEDQEQGPHPEHSSQAESRPRGDFCQLFSQQLNPRLRSCAHQSWPWTQLPRMGEKIYSDGWCTQRPGRFLAAVAEGFLIFIFRPCTL